MGPAEGSGMAKRAGGEEERRRPGRSDAAEVAGSGGGRRTAPRPQARLQTPAAAGAGRLGFSPSHNGNGSHAGSPALWVRVGCIACHLELRASIG